MQQSRYVHNTLPFPLANWFLSHVPTLPDLDTGAISSHHWLIQQYTIEKCFILSMFQKTNMFQWSTEHIFPAHWVGLKIIFHATVSTEPFPKVLNSYLVFLIPPLILLCFYFSEHDMKATFLYSFTFEISYISKLWCQQDNFISSPVKYICSTDVKQNFCFTTQFEASYISNWTKWYFVSMSIWLVCQMFKRRNPFTNLLPQDDAEWLALLRNRFSAHCWCMQTWKIHEWTPKRGLYICILSLQPSW